MKEGNTEEAIFAVCHRSSWNFTLEERELLLSKYPIMIRENFNLYLEIYHRLLLVHNRAIYEYIEKILPTLLNKISLEDYK